MTKTTRLLRATTVAAILLGLTGCAVHLPASAQTPGKQADGVQVSKAWVKAAGSGMTAAFGDVKNTGSGTAIVVGATSSAASSLQLHETVTKNGAETMQEAKSGFRIPAGSTLHLAPGGSHIMLMGLKAPLEAGQKISVTLRFSDGSTSPVAVPVKDFSGANENYKG
ncbi:hypothetical protein ATY41_09450 [Leifsonia xyli subsp. xyli]|uniref:Putative lipoprotein Lxx21020 n=2 Tax=Leifsonia xyli subsp. xyli TaxID=59736 RepID=Y2102_LEIXX|nr:copper chaperone PCu(A)C [Leifsonia xyli]Q6ACU3.2 RecName: Full=Putative lipoprotein Lxx21020; Flags: Precursor [Leifsonia xyli subsp. xyli str. CTCB07]ODA90638.1 hypothetical protein ATY41_09450 [Leifsonia xyli subsp. xyli]